jgi:hypothetical protein
MSRTREHQLKHLAESCEKVAQQFTGYPINQATLISIENKLMEMMDPVIGYPKFKLRSHGSNVYIDLDKDEEIIDI